MGEMVQFPVFSDQPGCVDRLYLMKVITLRNVT
jgi:hypothetical protein